jgi:predicted unusual protein kinase regulating ubiquinone biosynthesis (AarF/ABC1/UbiB family)
MDDLLNEYIEQEKQLDSIEYEKDENGLCIEQCEIEERKYLDYIERTKEYYYKMTFGDFFRAVWFTASSAYICATEYLKYVIGWKSRNHAIINVSKRLASINMMYVKIFQAFATNRNIVSPELNDFFSKYTDNVNYTDDEYDINELKELERRSIECAPYRQLRILNDYRPIKSGLMSLIFKGVMNNPSESNGEGSESGGEEVVIKYLRKNINKNFTSSMNNLVVFAKLTRYVPYLRTLNVESLILQNIVCLKDQVNFRKELANIILYYRHWHKYEYVKIPKPYPEFTENINPDAIVMEYVHGMKITEIDPEDNDDFGKVLASFNAKAAFCTSFYHGDLHPGNILFIKNTSASAPPIHQICILDFGIIGHLSRYDQELLFRATKFMYKRKFDKIIDIIMSCELSESADMKSDTQSVIPVKNTERYESLRRELTEVLVRYTTPEIRFFGVAEIYELNYILNNYGLMFKRSLYRLFITLAIMDSIGTRLGSKMSYFQYMTDIVVDMFNINHSDEEHEAEEEADEEEADEEEDDEEHEAEEEDEAEEEADEEEDDEAENNK